MLKFEPCNWGQSFAVIIEGIKKSSFRILFLLQVKDSLVYNFKTKNDEHCSNNKAEYFQSLIFGARGEVRKIKWNRVKKEISK